MTSSPAPTVVAAFVLELRSHVPFTAMSGAEVERIVRASRLSYFAPGDIILAPGEERPAQCYIIRKGVVRGERPRAAAATGDAAALWELATGDMFPLGALLAHRGVTSVYRAVGDTFCLAFPAGVFDALVASSPAFGDSAREGLRIFWIFRAPACRRSTRRTPRRGKAWPRHWPTFFAWNRSLLRLPRPSARR